MISLTYYVHGDHPGSARLVMTNSLTVAFSTNYVPYGPNYGSSGSEVFMYTDKPYDSVTGLYYYGARFYDPATGRFITQDSYTGTTRDPVTQNRYIYASDNPMKLIDSNGHSGQPMDFGSWFKKYFFLTPHLVDFTMILVAAITAVVDPLLWRFNHELTSAAVSVLSLGVQGGGDTGAIVNDLSTLNTGQAAVDALSLTSDILSSFWSSLSFLQIMEVIAEGGAYYVADVISAGTLSEAATLLGLGMLGVSIGKYIGVALGSYQTYSSASQDTAVKYASTVIHRHGGGGSFWLRPC
ncbi:MAG: RHS repeat-associated core domain-containing protein [Nitrososphaerales archaeon]